MPVTRRPRSTLTTPSSSQLQPPTPSPSPRRPSTKAPKSRLLLLPFELLLSIADHLPALPLHRLILTHSHFLPLRPHLRRLSLTTLLPSNTPILIWAVTHNRPDLLTYLLLHHTPHTLLCPSGSTALQYAGLRGHVECCRLLLEAGADVEGAPGRGVRPLRHAVHGGHTEVVGLLVRYGADMEHRGLEGYSVVTDAALRGHEGIVRCLLRAGAREVPRVGVVRMLASTEGGGFGRITEMMLEEVERRGCVGEWDAGELLKCYREVRERGGGVERRLSRLVARVYGREFMALNGYRVYRRGKGKGKGLGAERVALKV